MSTPLSSEKILNTGMAFWASKTLLSAIELEVFTQLADGPASFESLCKQLKLHPRSARDFLDALASLGFLSRDSDVYANTPETDLYLDRNKSSYVGGLLEMANSRLYPFWANLTEGLRTGLPQNEIKTSTGAPFEALYADPKRLKELLSAMTGLSHGANVTLSKAFDWQRYNTFIDVGTAQGDLAVQVVKENPHLRGMGFDLPPVEPVFADYAAAHGVASRLAFISGDFFKDDFPKADVVLMGHVLHDWDLVTKKMLIKKAYDALPSGGTLIVYEAMIDDDRSVNSFGLLMSLNMLIETPGGFDYTSSDCSGWMKEAGFKSTRVEHLIGHDTMVAAIK